LCCGPCKRFLLVLNSPPFPPFFERYFLLQFCLIVPASAFVCTSPTLPIFSYEVNSFVSTTFFASFLNPPPLRSPPPSSQPRAMVEFSVPTEISAPFNYLTFPTSPFHRPLPSTSSVWASLLVLPSGNVLVLTVRFFATGEAEVPPKQNRIFSSFPALVVPVS